MVAQAGDGEEAVELARAEQPDLVLLDISMPAMDGIEALPLVQQVAPRAAIVMLSGYPDEAVTRGGADGLLDKDDLFHGLEPALEAILATRGEKAPAMVVPT